MNLYYAPGGGLGHLVRARAVTATLGIASDTLLLASSLHAGDSRVTGSLPVRRMPADACLDPSALRRWLDDTIATCSPRALYVDTFPNGILGELGGWAPPRGLRVFHVARLLGPASLAGVERDPGPRFATAYVTEELPAAQVAFLRGRSDSIQSLQLRDPEASEAERAAADAFVAQLRAAHPRFWLVVHSGPADEVDDLLGFAADLRSTENADVDLVLLTPEAACRLPNRTWRYDHCPAADAFPWAERIVSAAGFNIVRQAAAWRDRHVLHPFPRRHDDQFARAARARVTPTLPPG